MTHQTNTHQVTLDYYKLNDLRIIVDTIPRLELHPDVIAKIVAGAQFVLEKAAEDRYIYGTNTGFGSLCETRVENEEMEMLQFNHVVSHAVGVGEIVPEKLSRLMLFVKLLTFRTGHTGISMAPVQRLIDMWNHDIVPAIPKKGTVGASGDLAPLAHMALPLLGLGKVYYKGEIVESAGVLEKMGWEPLRLKPKEGLALTNGVQYINSRGALALMRIEEMIKVADLFASMSSQAFSTSETFYQAPYHETTFHPERKTVAANFRKVLEGSNHYELPTCNKSKQDPYSFRCIPQVHGAIRQAVNFAIDIIEKECNGVSDNPLFFPESGQILFGGNLHGESTALALDFVAMATSEMAYISERRTYQLLSGMRGLPDFLVNQPGLNSGFMIVQYTAAALMNENKVLCTPASVDTIPTCQLQEDHVSMGGTSSYKLETIVDNAEYILGIELLTAVQAIDFNKPLELSPATQKLYDEFREQFTFMERDRVMSDDMERARVYCAENRAKWIEQFGLA